MPPGTGHQATLINKLLHPTNVKDTMQISHRAAWYHHHRKCVGQRQSNWDRQSIWSRNAGIMYTHFSRLPIGGSLVQN